MITSIHLQNFRIFDENAEPFQLSPLTVICGTNSAGKSSLFKALLLLRQSQGIRETYTPSQGRLRFVGSQVDLGNYASVVSHNDVKREISLNLTLPSTISSDYVQMLRLLKTSKKARSKANAKLTQLPTEIRGSFTFDSISVGNESAMDADITESEWTGSTSALQGWLKNAHYELLVNNEVLLDWVVRRKDAFDNGVPKYEILIPLNFFSEVGGLKFLDVSTSDDDKYIHLQTVLRGLLPDRIVAKRKKIEKDPGSPIGEEFIMVPLPPGIDAALVAFRRALTDIHYLGPLRSPAQRYYIANMDTNPGLDARGDFLPYLLREKNQQMVKNCVPDSYNAPSELVPITEGLNDALNKWLHFIRTGEYRQPPRGENEIIVNSTKEVLVEFMVMTERGGEAHALADSGFGYSQILPILVRGLLAEPGSTVIIEQPELHLNPALQVRLAQFIVAMVRAGKQILIETHSEHIINMFRVLSAEDETGTLAGQSQIWFLDSDEARSRIYKLDVGKDGMVTNWPRHFFGEAIALTSRLLRAQKAHRVKLSERDQ